MIFSIRFLRGTGTPHSTCPNLQLRHPMGRVSIPNNTWDIIISSASQESEREVERRDSRSIRVLSKLSSIISSPPHLRSFRALFMGHETLQSTDEVLDRHDGGAWYLQLQSRLEDGSFLIHQTYYELAFSLSPYRLHRFTALHRSITCPNTHCVLVANRTNEHIVETNSPGCGATNIMKATKIRGKEERGGEV